MAQLILVRHGQTEWNTQQRVTGGGTLDPKGRTQIAALADRLRPEPLAVVYASPTLRTLQTARTLAKPHGLPIRQRKSLLDLDYGDYAGRKSTDAQQADPALWKQWLEAPDTVHFPEGESLADLRRRMERFLMEVSAQHSTETVLAVSHDSPIRTLVCMALGVDDSHHQQFVAQIASITTLEVTEAHCRLLTFSDTDHLQGIDAGS